MIYRDPLSEHNNQKFAMKVVGLHLDEGKNSVIENEIVSMMNMKSKYVVRLYDAFSREGNIEMILEYMDLGSLEDICKIMPENKIPHRVLRELAGQLVQSLAYLEEEHIVHRDIKPANCLVNKVGECKLGDFGFSRRKKDKDVFQTFQGSMIYMSPERIKGDEHSYNSDVWSLGLTILECAIGRYPYMEKDEKQENLLWFQAQDLINRGFKFAPGEVSEDLENFVRECTVVDPEKRPNASDLLKHPFLSRQNKCTRKWIRRSYKKAKKKYLQEKQEMRNDK